MQKGLNGTCGYRYILSMVKDRASVERYTHFCGTAAPRRCTAISVGATRYSPAIGPISIAIVSKRQKDRDFRPGHFLFTILSI